MSEHIDFQSAGEDETTGYRPYHELSPEQSARVAAIVETHEVHKYTPFPENEHHHHGHSPASGVGATDDPLSVGLPGAGSRSNLNAGIQFQNAHGSNEVPTPQDTDLNDPVGRERGAHTPSVRKAKPGVGDRILGELEVLEGKLTHNPKKVEHGEELKVGHQ